MTAPHPVDPSLLRRLEPVARQLERYFKAEVRGLERIPEGACLLVGNHNGGVMTPDSYLFGVAYYRHTGWREPILALAHDALLRVPGLKQAVEALGGIRASPANAVSMLRRGHKILVYPGGDWETHRPSWMRDRIDFAGRTGFIEMAMRAGVPIVPVVSAGAHDGWYVMTRGDRIARKLRLDRLFRIRVFPVAVAFPTGLILGPVSIHLPPPGRILIEVGEPIRLRPRPDDPAALEAAYHRVTGRMQAILTRLAAELRDGGPASPPAS